jgi:hypothetical protein
MKMLKYIGESYWSYPLYEDENGTTYVEVDGTMMYHTPDWDEPICPVDFDFIREPVPQNPQRHTYAMLSMKESSVKYFLGWGKGHLRHLSGESIETHIQEMKDLWNSLIEKPEWLSMEQIETYHKQMLEVSYV